MAGSDQTVTTDILIIGAGFAGCFGAIRVRELGAEVVIVEQGVSGFSGMSAIGTMMTRVLLPEDDFDKALEGTVLESDYMIDQEYAESALSETWDRMQEFLKLGVDFRRDDSGQIRWYIRNTPHPYQQRWALWEPMGSSKHLMKVKIGALRLGAKVIDRTVVTDLLTSGGKVIGAVGFNQRDGDFYIFRAKAVVMAASSCWAFGRIPSLTGDGEAMALRAGAELRGLEFGKVEIGAAESLRDPVRFSVSPEEIRIVNARGEEFVEQYELLKRLPGRLYCGPPWKLHIPAMLKECREGRGPCYVEVAPDKSSRMREYLGSFQDQAVAVKRLSGFPPDRLRYELGLGGYGSPQNGGIRITPYGLTTVPGLFAAGVASDMCCAPHYSIPANIMGSHIIGRRAGESAFTYARDQVPPEIDQEEVRRLKKEVYSPLGRKKGIDEEKIRIKMIEAWPNLDLRNQTNLTKAIQDLRQIEQEGEFLMADDFHELAKCAKIRNAIQAAQAMALAAKARRESRMEHFREDYPLMDNKNWLKWVIVHGTGDRMEAFLEDIPIGRWKYRPEPVLVDRSEPRRER